MPDIVQDKELVAVPLRSLIGACCEFRVPLLVEHGVPFHSQPFRFEGEIRQIQTSTCCQGVPLTVTNIFQVPAGMTGVITGISITEKYAGILSGTKISLLINGETTPQWAWISENVGIGPGYPAEAEVFLKESDQVALFFQTWWNPMNFTSPVEIGFGISFVITGYYLDKEIYSVDKDNMEVGALPPSSTEGGC